MDACRKLRQKDNGRRIDAWIVEAGASTQTGHHLSLLKGRRSHLLTLQNGCIQTAPSGRFRSGFWEGGTQHVSSLEMTVDGLPSGGMFRKYVRRLHCTYRSYGAAERLDFVHFSSPMACIAVRSDGGHDIVFRLEISHKLMWPDGRTAPGYEFQSSGGSGYAKSELAETFFKVEGGSISFGGNVATVLMPSCTESMLVISAGPVDEGADLEGHRRYFGRVRRRCVLRTPDFAFNKAFLWAKHTLLEMYSESEKGNGFFAGFPEFSWFFGRDGEWMSQAAVECGLQEFAREHLATLRSASEGGRIPHEIPLGEAGEGVYSFESGDIPTKFLSIDSTPLWIMCQIQLSKWSGLPPPLEQLRESVEFCKACDRDGDGLVENRLMDGLIGWPESWAEKRDGACIDANAWWLEALKQYSALTGGEVELLEKARRNFLEKFLAGVDQGSEPADSVFGGRPRFVRSAMEVVPAMYEKGAPYSRLVEIASGGDMLTAWGTRSMSSLDPMYDRGYHTGQVWPLMTGWFAIAAFNCGYAAEGMKALGTFPLLSFNSPDPGRINEVYHSEYLHPMGQFAQGWSSSLFIQSVIEGLFGIRPAAGESGGPAVECSPSLPDGWNSMEIRSLECRGTLFDIRVDGRGVEIRKSVRA